MGLMNFIRQNLPESWEKAATEMRMKTELITRLHNVVPRAIRISITTKKVYLILEEYSTLNVI